MEPYILPLFSNECIVIVRFSDTAVIGLNIPDIYHYKKYLIAQNLFDQGLWHTETPQITGLQSTPFGISHHTIVAIYHFDIINRK